MAGPPPDQTKPPVINTHSNDDSSVRSRKRDKICAFFCICFCCFEFKPKSKKGKAKKGKAKKGKADKAPEGTSIPPSPAPNGFVSQSPAKPTSDVAQVEKYSSGINNAALPEGTEQNRSTSHESPKSFFLAAQADSYYSGDNQSARSTSTARDESASQQPSTKPSSIGTNFDEDDLSNSKSIVPTGTVQYWPPSLQPGQPSRILSETSSDPSPSGPPSPSRAPSAPRTVQATDAMYQPLNSSSQGLNPPSLADRPATPRTVQGTHALDQLMQPSSTISQGDHSPLTNNQPVAPTVSQSVPSSDNQQALSVDSHVFPSSNNQFASSYDNQFASSYDNQPLPINNNQSVACGDIQPVPSSAEENTSLPPFPTEAPTLSAGPKEEIQSYIEQQTGPSTPEPHSLGGEVLVAAFTSDGRHILSCQRHQGLEQWDSQTGARVPLPHEMTCGVCTFTISPNGAQVATGCFDGSIRLWKGQAYAAERALLGPTSAISKLVYSPCCRWLVSCDINGTVRLWDLVDIDDRGEIVEIGAGNGIFKDVVFARTGHEFTALSNGLVRFYDPRKRNPCTTEHDASLNKPIFPLDYSQDGLRLVFGSESGSFSVYVRDPQFESDFELKGHGHKVVCAAFSPCGEWILSGSRDKTVRLWLYKVGSWSCAAVVSGCSEAITCLAWNPVTPREFVTGCHDGSVRVWRVSSAEAEDVSVRMVWGTDVTGLTCRNTVGF